MTDDTEIQNALLAIHSRLGTIEGKINLVARAEREEILAVLEQAIRADPILGQVYLLLDGKRNQQAIRDELSKHGITCSQPTLSRRMTDLVTEYGIADPVSVGGATVLRKNRASEDVLNLSKRVRRWLESRGSPVPQQAVTRQRATKKP